MKRFFILTLIISSLFSACQKDNVTIHLIETTDVHGRFFNFDFVNDTLRNGSLAQFATYIDSLRKVEKNVILMDNGDIIQGDPAVYYSNYIDTANTNLLSNIYSHLKYDVATVGNHDIEAGAPVYNKIKNELQIPWLGANVVNEKTGKPAFQPYQIIKKEGVKIAIIGITTPGIPNWLPKKLYEGLKFEGMVESAQKWMKEVKKENPDIIVGLFHSGLDANYGGNKDNDPLNPNATLTVAKEVEGFDVIFAGHDHRQTTQKIVSNNGDTVFIVNAGSHARYAGHVTINYSKKNNSITNIDATLDNLQLLDADETFVKIFTPYINEVKEFFNQPIGKLNTKLCPQKALFGPSEFMQFIHSIQLFHTKADVSLSAPLQIRNCIDPGTLYLRDIFALYKFENYLATINMSIEEIDLYLEYAIKGWFNTMKSETDQLLQYNDKMRLANPYYNFSSAAGIDYTIDVTAPVGNKVTITAVGNKLQFNENDTLRVAINSYRMVGGGGHLPYGVSISRDDLRKRKVELSNQPIKSIMIEYFKLNPTITVNIDKNWKLLPEKWVNNAKEKEISNF
jgi:2',3'-cyclic-nucleotide 2'-phosphodiesterase/3'-nucleotidase